MHPSLFQVEIEPNDFLEHASEQPGYGGNGRCEGNLHRHEKLMGHTRAARQVAV